MTPEPLLDTVRALDLRLRGVQVALNGDTVVARHSGPVPPSIVGRVPRWKPA